MQHDTFSKTFEFFRICLKNERTIDEKDKIISAIQNATHVKNNFEDKIFILGFSREKKN